MERFAMGVYAEILENLSKWRISDSKTIQEDIEYEVASNIFCPSSCVNILSDVTKEISDATYEYYQSRN
jgi:hypothetical protein